MSVDSDISASEDLFGKTVDELQENVIVTPSQIKGSLKYVTGYTGFSSKPEEQSGHYLTIHASCEDADEITVELVGGYKGPVRLDDDGLIVLRITNPKTQSVRIVATKGGQKNVKVLTLKNLELEAQA